MICICKHPFNVHGQLGCAIDNCHCSGFNQMNEEQYENWIVNND